MNEHLKARHNLLYFWVFSSLILYIVVVLGGILIGRVLIYFFSGV